MNKVYLQNFKEITMLDPKKLEEIAKNISNAIPPGVKSMADEAEGKIKQVLQAQLTKLDFVSREEFDVQSQVLIRTREKLEALETRLAALEEAESK
jgi:BMFP domain-containing protein YqiC